MTQIETPKVVKKKLFSPIWLLPIVAVVLGSWLGIKSIREAGIEVRIHFPSATGIDVGKTLVRYQGLTVGKVVDISIDDDLQGVNVDLKMDYRTDPFLNEETKFWLVTPKASITGVEGLDALFSGNYIGIQPGGGKFQSSFEAETNAPIMLPETDGLIIELTSDTLGSLDVGSQIFYRQIPVGKVISYRLEGSNQILLSAFIQKQYAHLVKTDSQFWNVSGLTIDASLSGIQIKSESLSTILAGGLSFSSSDESQRAKNGHSYHVYDSQSLAQGGIEFRLTANDSDAASTGTSIVFRGIEIGRITDTKLTDSGVHFTAKIDKEYAQLLSQTSNFWLEGAEISLSGIKHAARLLTGSVINFSPGTGEPAQQYALLNSAPEQDAQSKLQLSLTADNNPGVSIDAEVRYKQLPIGKVNSVRLNDSLTAVEYGIEIWPEFSNLVSNDSYFVPESALSIDASIDGVSVKTRDLSTLTNGAISLIQGQSKSVAKNTSQLSLFISIDAASQHFANLNMTKLTLTSPDGAGLSSGSPIYYQKMQIGKVDSVSWIQNNDKFAIKLSIQKQFDSLVKTNSIFWRNSAMTISAALSGIEIDVAPLAGAIKGSITLGLLDNDKVGSQTHLYGSKALALAQALPITLTFPADVKLAANAPIRYLGHKVGEIERVTLNNDLRSISADAYLYGDYAKHFTQVDAEFFLVDAEISLSGIKAPETILTGPYVGVKPGVSLQSSHHFNGAITSSVQTKEGWLQFTLEDSTLGSIKAGTPIIFRGIKIGSIDAYRLSDKGNSVQMSAHIEPKYRHLVNQSSQFWDLSGVKIDVGLFSGAKIETGSLESILAGGVGVVTEMQTKSDNQLAEDAHFILHKQLAPNWVNWAPEQNSH
ncbi:MCE family protein [Shewanella eurypsychrophilus]|uniref:MCE family protein n=1 Tax=Shewanella eurypsychrophilus TaxID=2593656 RepID=A0ABX6V9A0_9GAMM|nr:MULTISPECIES: MlaD family protein [Shewanella]QFU23109.1 MCE family protein [Shewanella sp. YLB-09]QPG58392.1 MCE family protein [Shewanella eurypsychrophilus]